MAGTNNFLVFNEANNPTSTMSDADYLADLYRLNGLIPMIADPNAHNKMFRQWSIMVTALANIITSMNYNASDDNLSTLQTNLKSAIEDVAEAKVDSRISTLENWKDDITATPAEINILDGVTASTSEINILDGLTASTSELNILDGVTADTAELNTLDGITASTAELNILHGVTVDATEINYLDGAESNIQQQINSISGSLATPFPAWIKNTAYAVGDICICSTFDSYKYLECVVAGTTDTTPPSNTNVGQLITDNTVKWLVCDWRDSAPVGTIKQDLVKRDGWLKLNGATINVADYPRLVNFLVANSLIHAYTVFFPVSTNFTYGDSNNETLILPDFEGLFIENSTNNTLNKISAGLPNITGEYTPKLAMSGYSGNRNKISVDVATGAFKNNIYRGTYAINGGVTYDNSYTDNDAKGVTFDASRSSSIYGNSNTVQPPAVKLIPVIKY